MKKTAVLSNSQISRFIVYGKNHSHSNKVNYRSNTNLEQISDWLTKILVGVGLTQQTFFPLP